MSEFVKVMRDYKRMCYSFDTCLDGCPLKKFNEGCSYDDCLTYAFENPKNIQDIVEKWAEENPSPEYPTIREYLWKMFEEHGIAQLTEVGFNIWLRSTEIPAGIAEKLGIEPKEK